MGGSPEMCLSLVSLTSWEPWGNHFTFLSLSFLTHTMGILEVPASWGVIVRFK